MAAKLTTEESKKFEDLAFDAFTYGYPAVDNYRVIYEGAVAAGLEFNKFYGAPKLLTHTDTLVVAPNNDTAYSKSWVDLSGGPVEFTVPAITDRYWSFQFIDSFTNNVKYVGSRETPKGNTPDGTLKLLIVPPGWAGELPAGFEKFESPTKLLFLLGRTQILGGTAAGAGPDAAGDIMRKYSLRRQGGVPVAAISWLPIDPKLITAPDAFFRSLNLILTHFQGPNTKAEYDWLLMERLAAVGVGPGKTFDPTALGAEVMTAFGKGIAASNAKIQADALGPAGWTVLPMDNEFFGDTKSDYEFRAKVCRAGIYANTPEEAVYPQITALETDKELDPKGERLSAAGKVSYTLSMTEPPVLADKFGFWSVTIYNEAQFLVDNKNDVPAARTYSLGSQTPLVKKPGTDEVDIVVQFDKPADGVNWLPAPDGPFQLILRVYVPAKDMIDRVYVLPTVTKKVPAPPPAAAASEPVSA